MVGKVPIGSEHPVAKQTMCTTNTRDVEASVEQVFYYEYNNQFYIGNINIIFILRF